MRNMLFLLFAASSCVAPAGSQTTADTCSFAPAVEWAENFVAPKGEPRIVHIYWPDVDPPDINLYASLDAKCLDDCKAEPEDHDMYTFYRSTHYWDLEKVYESFFECKAYLSIPVKSESGKVIGKKRKMLARDINLTVYLGNEGCLLPGPRTQSDTRCI